MRLTKSRRLLTIALATATLALAFLVGRSAAERRVPRRYARARADTVLGTMQRVLRRDGLAAALDSLERRASTDTTLARDGHQMAHALGRAAVTLHGGDLTVIRDCSPAFASGCYHGVVEAALRAAGRIDMRELEQLCVGLGDTAGPGSGFECIHGLGHGVLGARDFDLRGTLRDCDALSTPRRATSCHLGAFMEAVNVVLGASALASSPHAGGHAHHSATPPLAIDPSDPFSPCRAWSDPYASSCWLFQGYLILRAVQFDAGRALALCDRAPTPRVARCYESVGQQLTGLFQRGDAWILEQCGRGRPALAAHCAAGATLALDAFDWTGTRAGRLCSTAPREWKETCYRAAADALVDLATPQRRATFCAGVEPEYVGVCRRAAEVDAAERGRTQPPDP